MSGSSEAGVPAPLRSAMDRHRAGEFAAAAAAYRRYLAEAPDDVQAWCLLAGAEGQGGRHAEALGAYRRAAEVAPSHAPAHAGLGTGSLHLGDFEGAVEHFRRALALDPSLSEARLQLATALRRLARLADATAELETLLEREPDHAQARFNFGMASLESGRAVAAEDAFRRVLATRPGLVPALVGLGRALQAQHRLDEARAAFDEAGAAAPGDPVVAVSRARLAIATGRLDDARRDFERALSAARDDADAQLGLAELDLLEGQPARGIARLEPLLERSPPGGVPVMLARLRREAGRADEAERLVRRQLGDARLMPGIRVALLRELGLALDARGDAEGAWAAWTEANAARATRFDPDDFDRAIDVLARVYQPPLLERAPAPPAGDAPRPLLIVGAPRSGKSLLEQILACHPAIRGGGEQRILNRLVEDARRCGGAEPYPQSVAAVAAADLLRLAGDYAAAVAAGAAGAGWVADTQPTNFLHVGFAALLRPDLRVVYCRRDPLDLAWACHARGFVDPAFDFAARPAAIGRYLTGLERLLAHWRRLLPGRVATVDYEALVRAPADTVRGLLDWLGPGWDPACAEYDRPGRPRLSSPPVLARAINAREIGRGRPYAERFPGLPPGSAAAGRD